MSELSRTSKHASSSNIIPLRPDRRATEFVTSLGLIRKVYPNALEFTARAPGTRGVVLLYAIFMSCLGLWGAYETMSSELEYTDFGASFVLSSVASICFVLFGVHFGLKLARLALFRPDDEPTVFDRKHRKVYRIYQESQDGWRGIFRHWPMKVCEYDWDLIDAEHHTALTANSAAVSASHALIFNVRKSKTDPTIVDGFAIGNGMIMGEFTVPSVWEHIRRFMEEDGPHLPPGDTVYEEGKVRTILHSIAAMLPYNGNLRRFWNERPVWMLVALVVSPIALPLLVLVGILGWIERRTAFQVEWPPAIKAAFES